MSLIEELSSLPPEEAKIALASLSDDHAEAIKYDFWGTWARESQQMPPLPWDVWLCMAGRGWGKTRVGAESVKFWVHETPGTHVCLLGRTLKETRETMTEFGESSIMSVSPPWFRPTYEPSKRRLVWPNGSTASGFSDESPEELRGPQFHKAWVDELAKFRNAQYSWDMLDFALRLGDHPQTVVTTTPRNIPLLRRIIEESGTILVGGHTEENVANLSRRFVDRVIKRHEGTRLAKQELGGLLLRDSENALWSMDSLDKNRVSREVFLHLEMKRVVVGVDPNATSESTSDAAGIITSGLGFNDHVYIFADDTTRGKPSAWGTAAVSAYNRHGADRMVGEGNNGGEMVEHVIRTCPGGSTVAYKMVHASRSKQTRAEPISAYSDQGKLHIVGSLPSLEDEMTTWEPGSKSPNGLDAMVWSATELMRGAHSFGSVVL